MDRAAGGLKQIGPRSLGFQNWGSSNGDIHDRSTTHTKPFLPFTAVSYPCRPRTETSAARDTDSGAALRAMAISAFRSIKYCSIGAMLGYGVFGPCAWDWHTPHSTIASATVPNAFIGTIFRFIASFEAVEMISSLLYGASPPPAFTFRGPAPCLFGGPSQKPTFAAAPRAPTNSSRPIDPPLAIL